MNSRTPFLATSFLSKCNAGRAFLGLALLALTLDVSGCKKEEKPDEKATTAESKPKPSKSGSKKPKVDEELVALAKVIKTEEDFEAAAEKEIVSDNLESEVAKLEKELAPAATQ